MSALLSTAPVREPIEYAGFRALVLDEILAALGSDKPAPPPFGKTGTVPWTWTIDGVESFEELMGDMRHWVDCLAAEIGSEVNSCNPMNKLPNEILSMIFAKAIEPDDIDGCMALTDVCTQWRDTIYANKTFWTTIRLNESERSTHHDDVLGPLEWRLGRAEPALVDLALSFPTGARSVRLDDPLREHMHHVRSFVLDIHASLLHDKWRTAFSMPAPCLSTLSINAQVPWRPAAQPQVLARFPENLFANDAPRLHTVFLRNMQLPAPTWSPLGSLTTFVYSAGHVDLSELARVVLACPSLHTLHFRVLHNLVVGDDARHPPQLHTVQLSPRLTSVAIWVSSPKDCRIPLNFFLNRIQCRNPQHSFLLMMNGYAQANLNWLSDVIRILGMDELHLSLRDRESTEYLWATARSARGKSRSTCFDVSAFSLSVFARPLAFITQLTLPEVIWPSDGFPSIPQLRVLTIALVDPGKQSRHDTEAELGIFFLSLQPGHSWCLPSLRSLQIAYTDAGDDDGDANDVSSLDERCYFGNPLVISAFEVAAFLRWNINSDRPIRLVLQNVLFLEPFQSVSMRRLNSLTEELVIEPVYSPRSFEVTTLL